LYRLNQTKISNYKLLEIINVKTEIAQQGLDLSCIMDLVTQKTQKITEADGACVELIHKEELVYSAASGIADRLALIL